jgi:hypothetical protein
MKQYDETTGQTQRQTHYIDNGKKLIFPKMSEGKPEIFKHKVSLYPIYELHARYIIT